MSLTDREIRRLREQLERPLPKKPNNNPERQRQEDAERMRRYEQGKNLKREW